MKSQKELENKGVRFKIMTLDRKVHSVEDVQVACGCEKSEVIKTLLFMGNQPIMVVVPGDRRVDLKKLKKIIPDSALRMAKPDDVKSITGYNIGSVTPFGVNDNINQIADDSVLKLSNLILGSGCDEVLIKMKSEEFKKSFEGSFESIID